jgi:hypothetical protein
MAKKQPKPTKLEDFLLCLYDNLDEKDPWQRDTKEEIPDFLPAFFQMCDHCGEMRRKESFQSFLVDKASWGYHGGNDDHWDEWCQDCNGNATASEEDYADSKREQALEDSYVWPK